MKKKDQERELYFKNLDWEILRFTNREVMENVNGVLEVISKFVREHNLT